MTINISLDEWSRVSPSDNVNLKGLSLKGDAAAQLVADRLRTKIDVQEAYQGLNIVSNSFVGRVAIGSLHVAINPKLRALPLSTLLRYVYNLRDVSVVGETRVPTSHYGFHDLLIEMLANEIEELLHRGLARRYISLSYKLNAPRGKILVSHVARQGGILEARLPCEYFERSMRWHLNQVLHRGLNWAAQMAEDRHLRRRVLRLGKMFGEMGPSGQVQVADVDQAQRALTRLTRSSGPALTIIRLLRETHGVTFSSTEDDSPVPGFLFDMNRFFQRLISRLLQEHIDDESFVDEHKIQDLFAYSTDANPRGARVAKPRPDYALLRNGRARLFLDAKYRDIWSHGLRAEWLYQVSVYAFAVPDCVSVLLYATTCSDAKEERIEIRPALLGPGQKRAHVVIRPVHLLELADLVSPEKTLNRATELRRFARRLVALPTAVSS